MAQLAIKGHPTRGSEVIALLEMLGGNNKYDLRGNEDEWFVLNGKQIQRSDRLFAEKGFTLEQFLEKFPYKIGDKVIAYVDGCLAQFTIQGIRWNHELNKVEYRICSSWCDTSLIQPYKEETMDKASKTIFDANAQCCDIMNHLIKEETMEENIKEKCDLINFNSHYIFDFADKVELILKDDWEVKNEDGRTYVVRKQQKYPKTFENCLKILGYNIAHTIPMNHGHNGLLMMKFQRLLIYRDAYWKIAGDWKPDLDSKQHKFAISNVGNKISFEVYGEYNSILCFPTEEMRNAFYENFKDLIEQCKELL